MTKIQLDLNEEENKMLELIKAERGMGDKKQAIKTLIHKYYFGWVFSPPPRNMQSQTLLAAVVDKVLNNNYWRDFRSNHDRNTSIKELKEVFDLNDVQLKRVVKELETKGAFKLLP